MTSPAGRQRTLAMAGCFGIGALLLVLALGFDPVGDAPDSGLIDLGPRGTRWLLGGFSLFFLLGGAWEGLRGRRSR